MIASPDFVRTEGMRLLDRLAQLGVPLADLVADSRAVKMGSIFAAFPGTVLDGRDYISEAITRGAAAVLWERAAFTWNEAWDVPNLGIDNLRGRISEIAGHVHGNPSETLYVVGVTGTNGKTSVSQWIASASDALGRRAAVIGTLGNGMVGERVEGKNTTPDPILLQRSLAEYLRRGARLVAMEVSSHGLDQGRVGGIKYDAAVFTNLTRDHLDYHGDMASYGAAKARLFAWQGLQAAAINLDDTYGRELHAALPATVRGIGLSSRGAGDATLRADALRLDSAGIAFDLIAGGQAYPVQSALLGRFNVDNLLAVAGALLALGDAPAQIAATLSRLQPVHGRMNRLGGDGEQPLVVIDYAHTPDALQQALASLRTHAQARLICVFGCGGERDTGKRPQMAAIAERHADLVIVTDDNPRAENGDAIVADIVAGFAAPERVIVQRDRAAAIARAIGEAGRNDLVLIAGKGHEPYQEIDGVQHAFDDTQVARAQLRARASHGDVQGSRAQGAEQRP